jgi:succinyl-diaminopimelate desuccinylase
MQEIIDLTKELIRFKTMHTEPDEIQRCMDFVQEYIAGLGLEARRLNNDYVPSLIVLPQSGHARVLLMSHIDVVDGPEELFFPREENGKLYGRGSIDDKYAVALSMVLLRRHVAQGSTQADLPFGVLITGDEEVGGVNGAKKALHEIKTEFCIALDGGSPAKIVTKEKGLLKLKLIARGKAAHGARPWLGDNAIEKLFQDYSRIKEFFTRDEPDHWHRTMNFSIVQAGKSHNLVPDHAEGVFDIRYTEHDDPDRLVEEFKALIQSELVVEAKEPLFHGGQSPYLQRLLELVPGTEVGFEHGASDARFLSEHSIPGIVWGADGEMSQHSESEHVLTDSVLDLARTLESFFAGIQTEPIASSG